MYTKYYIQSKRDSRIELREWFDTLKNAKRRLVLSYKSDFAEIVCIRGQYPYEGGVLYYITYNGTDHLNLKFKKHNISQLIFK